MFVLNLNVCYCAFVFVSNFGNFILHQIISTVCVFGMSLSAVLVTFGYHCGNKCWLPWYFSDTSWNRHTLWCLVHIVFLLSVFLSHCFDSSSKRTVCECVWNMVLPNGCGSVDGVPFMTNHCIVRNLICFCVLNVRFAIVQNLHSRPCKELRMDEYGIVTKQTTCVVRNRTGTKHTMCNITCYWFNKLGVVSSRQQIFVVLLGAVTFGCVCAQALLRAITNVLTTKFTNTAVATAIAGKDEVWCSLLFGLQTILDQPFIVSFLFCLCRFHWYFTGSKYKWLILKSLLRNWLQNFQCATCHNTPTPYPLPTHTQSPDANTAPELSTFEFSLFSSGCAGI